MRFQCIFQIIKDFRVYIWCKRYIYIYIYINVLYYMLMERWISIYIYICNNLPVLILAKSNHALQLNGLMVHDFDKTRRDLSLFPHFSRQHHINARCIHRN